MEEPGIFCLSSTYKAVFVDESIDYVQLRPTGALKNQIGAAKQHFISAKSFWRTALKDHSAIKRGSTSISSKSEAFS